MLNLQSNAMVFCSYFFFPYFFFFLFFPSFFFFLFFFSFYLTFISFATVPTFWNFHIPTETSTAHLASPSPAVSGPSSDGPARLPSCGQQPDQPPSTNIHQKHLFLSLFFKFTIIPIQSHSNSFNLRSDYPLRYQRTMNNFWNMNLNICLGVCGINQWLLTDSVELHKANMESRTTGGEQSGQTTVAATAASSALANALPLAQLLAKPGALSALGLSGLTALTSLSDLLTGTSTQQQASPIQTTGVHRSGRHSGGYEGKVRSSAGSSSPPTGVKKDRNKFAPY